LDLTGDCDITVHRLLEALLLTLVLVLYGCSDSRPSYQQVAKDCDALARITEFHEDMLGMSDVIPGTKLVFDSATIEAVSRDGPTAMVKATCHVTYSGKSGKCLTYSKGFGPWFREDMCHDGKSITRNVTLTYRVYDMGWQLETFP
jgi:hypothetical protein